MGRRGAAPGGWEGGSCRPIAACAGPPEDARQPMGERAGGGAATCCGVANVGPRRAALGPGGSGGAGRWQRLSPEGARRGGGAPAAAGPEPCGVKEEALPAAGTRNRPARRRRVDAGAVTAPRRRRPRRCCGRRSGAEPSRGPRGVTAALRAGAAPAASSRLGPSPVPDTKWRCRHGRAAGRRRCCCWGC